MARKIHLFPERPCNPRNLRLGLRVAVFPMNPLRLLPAATVLFSLVFTAGCGTPTQRDMMREAANTGEKPVAMKGQTSLLDGSLAAIATVSRGFDRGPKATRAPGDPKDSLEEQSRRGRRDRDSDGLTEVYSTGFGDSEEEQKEAMKEYYRMALARRAQGSPMPPVTLRVVFENQGAVPLDIQITEVNSELGNFAVRPDKLKLAPGEKGVLDPMISQLGVTSDEIPLKLTVRAGGKKETQVILVKNIILPSVLK
jgi:hypothetical protein